MTYSTTGTRFGGHNSFSVRGPMDDATLRGIAPSVFAVDKHASRSDRFTYIPTFDVLAGLRKEGFEVVAAVQGSSRVEGKAEFTKHMLRFRHPDYQAGSRQAVALGGVAPEAILINAHDGTSSYRLMSGLIRFVCLNSMIVMEDGATDVKVPHKGDILQEVIDASYTVIGQSKLTVDKVEAWNGVTLEHDEQMALAEAAHTLRFADAEGETDTPIEARQFLTPRRREDVGPNLWLTHNRIQEHVMQGGDRGTRNAGTRQERRTRTRPIKNISDDVRLNRALWQLSARMAELKGVAA